MTHDIFTTPSRQLQKRLAKEYNEADHPRDENGRWTVSGAAGAVGRHVGRVADKIISEAALGAAVATIPAGIWAYANRGRLRGLYNIARNQKHNPASASLFALQNSAGRDWQRYLRGRPPGGRGDPGYGSV
jgi:hypothetical protein